MIFRCGRDKFAYMPLRLCCLGRKINEHCSNIQRRSSRLEIQRKEIVNEVFSRTTFLLIARNKKNEFYG